MPPLVDIVGRRYGRWTVESLHGDLLYGGKGWNCVCDCGNRGIVSKANLRSGSSKSCGCLRADLVSKRCLNDLTGKRFGRYTVTHRGKDTSYGEVRWCCVCDCGEHRLVQSLSLVNGSSKSCGCLMRELVKERMRGPKVHFTSISKKLSSRLANYKTRAVDFDEEFGFSDAEFFDFCQKDCFYCGRSAEHFSPPINGIDRVNNAMGYSKENCVPCCSQCNIAKNKHSAESFIAMCENVVKNKTIRKADIALIELRWLSDPQEVSYA